MKLRKIHFLGLIIPLLISCASTKLTPVDLKYMDMQVPPGKAVIYIVRPTKMAFAIGFKTAVDARYFGTTKGGQYIFTVVEPGDHIITASSENDSHFPVKAEAGKKYYFEQLPKMGLIVARVELVPLVEADGIAKLAKCKLSSNCVIENVN